MAGYALLLVAVTVPHLLVTPFWDISSHVLYTAVPAGYQILPGRENSRWPGVHRTPRAPSGNRNSRSHTQRNTNTEPEHIHRQPMWDSGDRRLPTWIENAYEALAEQILTQEGGMARTEAEGFLTDRSELELDSGEANYVIEQLLDWGYLYQVDQTLFVTDSNR